MKKLLLLTFGLCLLLTSCKNSKEKNEEAIIDENTPSNTVETENTPLNETNFDISTIQLSTVAIGELPFFNLPEGYQYSHKESRDYESIRFWTGSNFETPEGNLFFGRISTKENKQFSILELTKNLEKVFLDAGAVQLFQGKVPREAIDKNEEQNPISDYGLKTGAYGFQGFAKTWTYVIRQEKNNYWIQLNESDDNASLQVALLKTKDLEITSNLIKAAQMKSELDQKGLVTLYINFDTNKSDIKPELFPAINEIHTLLATNMDLKISIEGHTDNVGEKNYNQKLSDLRAKEISNYLTNKGISPNRLKSIGFGDQKPLVKNDTEENKALNRRVELRKL